MTTPDMLTAVVGALTWLAFMNAIFLAVALWPLRRNGLGPGFFWGFTLMAGGCAWLALSESVVFVPAWRWLAVAPWRAIIVRGAFAVGLFSMAWACWRQRPVGPHGTP